MAGKKNWNNILFTMDNFRPQEIKMTNKVLIEKSSCCLLIQSIKIFKANAQQKKIDEAIFLKPI